MSGETEFGDSGYQGRPSPRDVIVKRDEVEGRERNQMKTGRQPQRGDVPPTERESPSLFALTPDEAVRLLDALEPWVETNDPLFVRLSQWIRRYQ